jgi:hypothetical protein
MSIEDLDLILKKDPIIATWPARDLADNPQRVEKDYLVHARTHLPLGDTAKYVDLIFKWVSGENKGTFIGAVLGDYGEGKTSFLVHTWAESRKRKVVAVPPFQWKAFEEIVDGLAGWVGYVLEGNHPDLARRLERIHEGFRQETIEDLARDAARETGRDYDEVLETVRNLVDSGKMQLTEMSPARVLDFVKESTEIVMDAGYEGLLLLLDEPEVAAKKLGGDTVQHFIFDLANELHQRQGNYGVFLSMPANFYASAQARFAALTARLEVRNCFPRLGDIYGPDFADVLWGRYVDEYALGDEGRSLVTPLALKAIGQAGDSENRHLSYGPRTVISAFRRMVDRYLQSGNPYEPAHFVQDVLAQEILVKPDYRSAVLAALRLPDVTNENREAVTLLAAFPTGLRNEVLRDLNVEDLLRPLARAGGLVHRTAHSMRLRGLRREAEGVREADLVRDMIEEIDGEYTPDRRSFENALTSFSRDVLPMIFAERKGQQLVGWRTLHPLYKAAPGVRFGTMLGSFDQTARSFPQRAVMVAVSGSGESLADIDVPDLDLESGLQKYDFLFHFLLRWQPDQEMPPEVAEISIPASEDGVIRLRLCLDLTDGTIDHEYLAELVGAERMTPLWVLNLLQRMSGLELPKEFEAEWSTLREMLLRQLVAQLMGRELSSSLTATAGALLGQEVTGSGLTLLDRVANLLLRHRYPDYTTLVRQPHWQSKVDDYVNALTSTEIPLACKRGREQWKAEADLASRVLSTSRMNLTGGAFEGLESLIQVESKGRNAPLQITFAIHPLEETIRDLVTSQPMGPGNKLKVHGKECWFMHVSDVLPTILNKGYTLDELAKVIEIGKARGSFGVTQHRGERTLYCAPLDPEELKAQLGAKLEDLEAEIKEYRHLPDYVTRFDPDSMRQAIAKVSDDADYDRLITRMNKEFEQNHNRLPGYFDRLLEQLQRTRSQINSVSEQTSSPVRAAYLEAPSAKSPWGPILGRLIVPNLRQTLDEVSGRSRELLGSIDRLLMRSKFTGERTPAENLDVLLGSWAEANEAETKANAICESARQFMIQLGDFDKWKRMLAESDQLYDRLLALRDDAAHEAAAGCFIDTFDQISRSIEDHIEVKNVAGLPAHAQFAKEFAELGKARQEYLASLKSEFDKYKDRVNSYLEAMNLGRRVAVVFNPADIGGCYDQLFSEAAQLVSEHGLARALDEIVMQERELNYARDVLQVIEDEAAAPTLSTLSQSRQALESLNDVVDPAWIREIAGSEEQGDRDRLPRELAGAFEAVRAVRKQVLETTRPPKQLDDPRAQHMFEMMPETGSVDLKQLVLQMMGQVEDPSQALSVSLDSLVELFRHNLVEINLRRRV